MAFILDRFFTVPRACFRQQLVGSFKQAGHRATAVATISEAASILEAEAPDLLAQQTRF